MKADSTSMTPCNPEDPKKLRLCGADAPSASPGAAWASFALAIIALVVGTGCIMGGQWSLGLIFVFAAVAGVMTAWQIVGWSTDDHHEA